MQRIDALLLFDVMCTHTSKETKEYVKRDLEIRQKRPRNTSTETKEYVKRDLLKRTDALHPQPSAQPLTYLERGEVCIDAARDQHLIIRDMVQ